MKVNEIFYSLQGEGFFTGTPAVFIRLSGCNLRCPFCDTDHDKYAEISEDAIAATATNFPARHIVITGGEPLIQLTDSLIERLHQAGKFIQIETNGTIPLGDRQAVDWVTCSPKFQFCAKAAIKIERINELKAVYCGQDLSAYDDIAAGIRFLQPCDTHNPVINQKNLTGAIDYIKSHPDWRLSLQTHKIINIP